jgi:hypothetical protein
MRLNNIKQMILIFFHYLDIFDFYILSKFNQLIYIKLIKLLNKINKITFDTLY